MQIIPSILVSTLDEFVRQLRRMEPFFPYVQIDVMDGKFVEGTSFAEVAKVPDIDTTLKYELHLMVENPLAEMQKWAANPRVFRAIFPIEAKDDPKQCIRYARERGWQVGIVLSPDTPLSAVAPYYSLIDVVLFMTVYPGKQGQPFVHKVKEKIKSFTSLPQRPLCSVDGAVNVSTIGALAKLGVDIVAPGSALTKAENVKKVCAELTRALVA